MWCSEPFSDTDRRRRTISPLKDNQANLKNNEITDAAETRISSITAPSHVTALAKEGALEKVFSPRRKTETD
jgi:hypothetical protein